MSPSDRSYDVIVVGGGPAGSSTAALVTAQGRRVLLLEKERFPRFRIGESFMPATWWVFDKLGVVDKLMAGRFTRKHSVQFYLKDGRPTRPFYFSDVDPHESSVTWQVDRGEFDSLLLDHAKERGVEVRQGVAVQQVLFEGARAVGVRAEGGGGPFEVRAPVVVDASGQAGLLSRALGLRRIDPNLRNAAVFTRFEGALRDPGIDAGATLVIHTRNAASWFWYIPLAGDVVSVGVVGPIEYIIGSRRADPQAILDEEIALCPALQPRLAGARQVEWVRVLRDFTYISRRVAGDGWLMVGDAFGFLDPIYSSGVLLALHGGMLASASIDEAFRAGDFSGERLGAHGPRFLEGMEAIRRLVYAFYAPDFHFKKFLDRFPECRAPLTRVLMGDVYRFPVDGLYRSMDQVLELPGYKPLKLGDEPL
ncbi:MAG TPA: NAD(P)/FAD-dependent oxidoreductase [Candidatus Polarisedimenticolia bacterium]|nr:NAD(P)/FAD-dependent oxidoreductase [Candidatus Polarisedimenticolia bacterium]